MQVQKQQLELDMEQQTGSKLGKAVYCHPAYLTYMQSESEVAQSCLTLCDPMDSSLHQAPPFMGFSRQEY